MLRSQRVFYRTALDQHALPFWYAHGYDAERGGFLAPVYADGHQQEWFLLLDALIDHLGLEPDDDLEQLAALCVAGLLNTWTRPAASLSKL